MSLGEGPATLGIDKEDEVFGRDSLRRVMKRLKPHNIDDGEFRRV